MLATSSVSVVNINDGQDGSPGTQGPQGIGITRTREQWFLSTSNQRTEGTERTITVDGKSIKVGQWIYEEPALIPDGYYLWGRIENVMSSGPNTYSDAVHRSVISGIKSMVDEDHSIIESKVWETYTQNQISSYDGSTVESIREDVSDLTQDLSGITTRVGNAETTLATKADGSTVQTLSNNFSTFQQTMNGFKTTVEQNYAQTSYVDQQIGNIKVGGDNLYIIADQVPGYLHQSNGSISAQNATGKEFTSAYIPVKEGESIIIQSWCTPLTEAGVENPGYSWLAYQFFSDDDPVTPVGNRVAKWGYSSGSGVETTADGKERLMYKVVAPANANYIRISYRSYEDGYAMVEKATTPSEYIINPRDLQDYTDTQVASAKSEIKQTTDAIELSVSSKVGNNEVISKINQSPEQIKISASKVDIEGAVTFSSFDTTLQSRIATAEGNASTALSNAATADDKASPSLGMKINHDAFGDSASGNGECYIHGYTNGVAANVDGYIYWNGVKRTVSKTMLNPNQVLPYYTTIYIVLRLSSASATTGTLYMVWYNSGWKYAITPTPTAVGGTWAWAETTDIVLGQFVEPSSEGPIVDAYLYDPPRNASFIQTTGNNSYQYSKTAVDWVGTNGSSVITAKDIISNWATDATSATTTIEGGLIRSHTITSNNLATDAIISNGYTADTSSVYSTVGTFLDLANGNIKSPTFAVDNTNGMAYIDGAITARYLYLGMSSADLASSDGTLASSGGDIAAIAPVLGSYIYYDGETLMINTQNFHIGSDGDVSMSGSINSTSGSIGGWKISENDIHYGMDIGQSRTAYLIPAGSTTAHSVGGSPTISGWTITSGGSFGVTNTGALYASDATVSGTISASNGSIGSWIINRDYLSYGTIGQANSAFLVPNGTSSTYTIGGSSAISGWVITAGANFGVTNIGSLYASSGKIGGWNITTEDLYMGDTGMSSNPDKWAFWAGETDDSHGARGSDANFLVGHNGHLITKNATISGGEIGGFSIGSNWIYKGTIGADASIFWGAANLPSATIAGKTLNTWRLTIGQYFGVTGSGQIYCSQGSLGGFTIGANYIKGYNNTFSIYSNTNTAAIVFDAGSNYGSSLASTHYNCYNGSKSVDISPTGGVVISDAPLEVYNVTNGGHVNIVNSGNHGLHFQNAYGSEFGVLINNTQDYGNAGFYDHNNERWLFRYYYNGSNRVWIGTGSYVLQMGDGDTANTTTFMARTYPGNSVADGAVYCGSSGSRWHTVYSKNGTSTSSDERLKTIYRNLGEDHKKLFMELKPIEYSFNDDLKVKHFGLGAQTTEASMLRLGFDSSYHMVEHSFYDEEDSYGRHDTYNMNYDEAAMLTIPVVQEHEKEIIKLKARITELENKLSQLTCEKF